mmetsp:Transcript_56944/g.156442  ORF Transcript_56944/g.156442 Transcript_56944/m.156442 type:complete len:89 (-) Transcript_56944:336-602(-)
MRDHACPTNVSMYCAKESGDSRYSRDCMLRPNNASCHITKPDVRKTNYFLCQYYPMSRIAADPKLNRFCLGKRVGYNESMVADKPPVS